MKLIWIVTAGMIALLWTRPCLADAALAIGLPPSVVKQGFVWGNEVNQPTMEGARKKALQACEEAPPKAPEAKSRCKVVATYTHRCFAVSTDPEPGTPGVGWAIGDNKREAERLALVECEKTAGPGRRAKCTVEKSNCDGTAQ